MSISGDLNPSGPVIDSIQDVGIAAAQYPEAAKACPAYQLLSEQFHLSFKPGR